MGVPRPPGAPATFACAPCGLLWTDGVDYAWCPRCGGEVDWVEAAPEPARRPLPDPARMARYILTAAIAVQVVLALLDPHGFPYLRYFTLALQLIALRSILALARALIGGEVRELVRDRKVRILHGLEHATARVLEERGIEVREGMTHQRSFTIALPHDGRTFERFDEIRAAAEDAIRRVRAGETRLAYSPRCGTSWLVADAVISLAVVGSGIAALIARVPHGLTFAGTVAAIAIAQLAAKPLGLLAQRAWTVSTAFVSASVVGVERWVSPDGRTLGFTVAIDVVPRDDRAEPIAVGPL